MQEDPFIEKIKTRLEHWAYWYLHGNGYGVGYPPCSIEYRLMKEGIVHKTQYPKPIHTDTDAEEIESWVCEMAHQNRMMALALRSHYFDQGSLRYKAKRLKISHVHFKYYVDMAHQRLAGKLSERAARYASQKPKSVLL